MRPYSQPQKPRARSPQQTALRTANKGPREPPQRADIGTVGADIGTVGADIGAVVADIGAVGADIGAVGADRRNFFEFLP